MYMYKYRLKIWARYITFENSIIMLLNVTLENIALCPNISCWFGIIPLLITQCKGFESSSKKAIKEKYYHSDYKSDRNAILRVCALLLIIMLEILTIELCPKLCRNQYQ